MLGFRRFTEEFEAPEPDEVEETDPGDGAGEDVGVEGDYETVLDRAALDRVVANCRAAGRFAVDTETDGTDPMRARLVGISLASAPGSAAYVPVGHRYLGVPRQLSIDEVREALGDLLADPAIGKIGQNLKYDDHVLRRHGLPVRGWALDTMVAAFVLDSSRASYKMDDLADEFLGVRTIPYAEIAGKGKSRRTLDEIEIDRVSAYAAEDADVTLRLADQFESRLVEEDLDRVYREIDHPVLGVLAEMEARGIRVDPGLLDRMGTHMQSEIDRLRSDIHELAGERFNVDSPKQLREVLFDRIGLKPRRKTAKGKVFSTDAATLEDLVDDHPIASKILEYREHAKLKSTYVDALPQLIHPETGRIHTSYHPTGAATGRLSSSDPNLQNIPARTEAGLGIRRAFLPEDGWTFVAADYSQVELRVLAHLCRDPGLIDAFRSGEDIHRVTAARVRGVEPAQVTPEMRRAAKAVNFGILYGMSESRLAREQGMSRDEAKAFIEAYFERFAAVREYIESVREQAVRDAEVRTLFGRVRRFPQLHGKVSRPQQEQALRAAVNTTIQGTAADLMKLAMVAVRDDLEKAGMEARILLQVHDELLVEVPPEEVDAVVERVPRVMAEVHPMEVPLSVDVKTGGDWGAVT
jgi:DNA polymerase-1